MKKNYVLKISERKGAFSQAFECSQYGETEFVTIKNKASALRKLVRKADAGNIIIAAEDNCAKIYENRIKEYISISDEVIIAVIEKICRQSAKKFSLQIPFGEIYVVAPVHIACALINALNGLSRLFTIVSQQEVTGRMYDELYFKNGTIIRHIPCINSSIPEEAIIIRYSEEKLICSENTVLIDLCKNSSASDRKLSAADVCIYDESIAELQRLWGGKSGAALYTLAGKIPEKNAVVDINKSADRIFLLDTELF